MGARDEQVVGIDMSCDIDIVFKWKKILRMRKRGFESCKTPSGSRDDILPPSCHGEKTELETRLPLRIFFN